MLKIALAIFLGVCPSIPAQDATSKFEVASVKLADPNGRGTRISNSNGKYDASGVTVKNCIMNAYNIQAFQLEGGPASVLDQRYDIVAKLPVADPAQTDPHRRDQMRLALQAMLAERFGLVVHRESKLVPAYELVVAKSGFKLKEVQDGPNKGSMSMNRTKLKAEGLSLELLARTLAGTLGSPVVDKTGIKGIFDFTLEWTPDEVQGKGEGDASEPAAGPSIFTAVQEQLGLRLDKQKTQVEVIVIDRIEKATEN